MSESKSIAVLASGSGSNFQALVEALCKASSIDVDSVKAAVAQQIG